MGNCLVTKLKGTVDNDNLEIFNLLKLRISRWANGAIWLRGNPMYIDRASGNTQSLEIPAMQKIYDNYRVQCIEKTDEDDVATIYFEDYSVMDLNLNGCRIHGGDLEKIFKKGKYLPFENILINQAIEPYTIRLSTEDFRGVKFANNVFMNTYGTNITWVIEGDIVDLAAPVNITDVYVMLISPLIATNLDNWPVHNHTIAQFAGYCHGDITKLPLAGAIDLRVSKGFTMSNAFTGEIADLVSNWRAITASGKKAFSGNLWNSTVATWNGTPLKEYVVSQGFSPDSMLYLNWDANSFSLTAS